jgi:hypothetical protein
MDEHIEFNLRHIEPASVFGSIDKFKTVPDPFGFLGIKGPVKRAGFVGV